MHNLARDPSLAGPTSFSLPQHSLEKHLLQQVRKSHATHLQEQEHNKPLFGTYVPTS